jgi:hypothetical protein
VVTVYSRSASSGLTVDGEPLGVEAGQGARLERLPPRVDIPPTSSVRIEASLSGTVADPGAESSRGQQPMEARRPTLARAADRATPVAQLGHDRSTVRHGGVRARITWATRPRELVTQWVRALGSVGSGGGASGARSTNMSSVSMQSRSRLAAAMGGSRTASRLLLAITTSA